VKSDMNYDFKLVDDPQPKTLPLEVHPDTAYEVDGKI